MSEQEIERIWIVLHGFARQVRKSDLHWGWIPEEDDYGQIHDEDIRHALEQLAVLVANTTGKDVPDWVF